MGTALLAPALALLTAAASFDIVHVLILLVVVGVVWWLIETYVPLPDPIKTVIRIVLVLVLCLWLLRTFGIV